jgi:hypothetical protein
VGSVSAVGLVVGSPHLSGMHADCHFVPRCKKSISLLFSNYGVGCGYLNYGLVLVQPKASMLHCRGDKMRCDSCH